MTLGTSNGAYESRSTCSLLSSRARPLSHASKQTSLAYPLNPKDFEPRADTAASAQARVFVGSSEGSSGTPLGKSRGTTKGVIMVMIMITMVKSDQNGNDNADNGILR